MDVYIDHGEVPLHCAAVGRCWQTKDKDAEKQTEKQYVQCFTTIKHWFRPTELYNAVFSLIGWVIGAEGQVYDFMMVLEQNMHTTVCLLIQ